MTNKPHCSGPRASRTPFCRQLLPQWRISKAMHVMTCHVSMCRIQLSIRMCGLISYSLAIWQFGRTFCFFPLPRPQKFTNQVVVQLGCHNQILCGKWMETSAMKSRFLRQLRLAWDIALIFVPNVLMTVDKKLLKTHHKCKCAMDPYASIDWETNGLFQHPSTNTHRRLRLPKVPQFRDWFGVSWLQCTFKHIPHSTFRVFNLGIGLGFHGPTAPENTYYTPRFGF